MDRATPFNPKQFYNAMSGENRRHLLRQYIVAEYHVSFNTVANDKMVQMEALGPCPELPQLAAIVDVPDLLQYMAENENEMFFNYYIHP